MNNIDVSIIFVNYKTISMTCDAINSVIRNTAGINYEIIVVDNSNNINLFRELKENIQRIDEKIIIVNPQENLGFGRGNNFGSKFAHGKYLLFLNTDTYLINNAIYEIYGFMESTPKCGVCGGNLLSKDNNPNTSFCKYKTSIISELRYLFGIKKYLYRVLGKRTDFNFTDKPLKIKGYISGADLMIRKNLFDLMGGFDKDIFMYYEENLLCYRAQYEMGYQIYNIPSAKIVHFEGGSIKKLSNNQVKESINGSYIMFSKIYGKAFGRKYLLIMLYSYTVLCFLTFFNKNKNNKMKLFRDTIREKLVSL